MAEQRRPGWHVGVVSFAVLALELALIRLVPAEVRVVAYFTNSLLFAAFFGLGLGAILQLYRDLSWTLPLGLAAVAVYVAVGRGVVVYDEARIVHFWLGNDAGSTRAPAIPMLPAVAAAFVTCSLAFVGLGQKLARLMDGHARLHAYGWDIAGSLIGTIAFAVASAFGVPPWLWPPVVALMLLVISRRSLSAYATCLAGALFLMFGVEARDAQWSPYYLIEARTEPAGLRVFVNSSFHQFAVSFRDHDLSRDPKFQQLQEKFSTPYRAYLARHGRPPQRVLILGAGTGNDAYIASANGAREIVAVEIDPLMLELGKSRNRAQPYADPRVRIVNDDARHFLHTTREQFDLIIFGTLDSQTLLSGHANLRLDNFVYTREAIADARRALSEDGMIGMYYSVFQPWLYGRLLRTAGEGFGAGCAMQRFDNPALFNAVILCSRFGEPAQTEAALTELARDTEAATDDWPFIYLERRVIAPIYLQSFALLAGLVLIVARVVRKQYPGEPAPLSFFMLGLGFTLVESAAVVRLSLLFGSTWLVNAVVFASVLATVFCANAAVLKGRAPRLELAWIGVVLPLALNALLPIEWLLSAPIVGRIAATALLVGAPMFFAAVCFSHLFSVQRVTGLALGINLVGAMAGGGLEYISMVTGMASVWWLAVAVYLAAWLAHRRRAANWAHGAAAARSGHTSVVS